MKEGETIKINIQGVSKKTSGQTKSSGGGLKKLAPPKGLRKLAPPPGSKSKPVTEISPPTEEKKSDSDDLLNMMEPAKAEANSDPLAGLF